MSSDSITNKSLRILFLLAAIILSLNNGLSAKVTGDSELTPNYSNTTNESLPQGSHREATGSHIVDGRIYLDNDGKNAYGYKFRPVFICVILISMPCILVTMLIYIWIRELRTSLGKCLLAYLANMEVYLGVMSYVYLTRENSIEILYSRIIIFAYISTVLWTNIISFELWLIFRSTVNDRKFSDRMQFTFYLVYVYGLTVILILLGHVCLKLKGDNIYGYYKFATRSAYLGISIVFFILTMINIIRVKRDIKSFSGQQPNGLSNDNYTYYIRMLIISGITRSVDVYFCLASDREPIIKCMDYSQGIFIGVLFVLKSSTLRLIKKRWSEMFKSQCHTSHVKHVVRSGGPELGGTVSEND